MTLTRRDVLFGLGGGVAGVTLTPLPWKLLDDVAIWTQRRHALPLPPRGEVTFAATACCLCPAACALRVRRVGARPVAVFPERNHPLGAGACPLGLTLHHLACHPLRIAGPARRVGGGLEPCSHESAVAAIVGAARDAKQRGQTVMVVDRRPGRVVSEAWRELLAALPHGAYVTLPGEGETLAALEASLASPVPLGVDLERTRTVLSFGTPLLDGWDRPGRLLAARGGLRVIQVEAWRSPTAATADEWVRIPPGTEGALALGLAHVVSREQPGRVDDRARQALSGFDPRTVSRLTGLEPTRIESLGRELLAADPAVAIGGGDPGGGPLGADAERAIALLDVALGSLGRAGGIVTRRALPTPEAKVPLAPAVGLAELPAGSVRLAILDAGDDGRALPPAVLRRTLAPDALVVSLSPFDHELAREAQVLLPSPAPLETWNEVLPTAASALASYALAAPLLSAPAGATDALDLCSRLAQGLGFTPGPTHEERLRSRAAALAAAAHGRWLSRGAAGFEAGAAGDAEAAWTLLEQGGCWIDTAAEAHSPLLSATPLPSPEALARWRSPQAGRSPLLVTTATRGTAGATPVSPLLTKLYQESGLRLATSRLLAHPETLRALGLAGLGRLRVEGAAGTLVVAVQEDLQQPAQCVVLASGPERRAFHPAARPEPGVLMLVAAGADGSWRETRVALREA